MKNYDKMNDIEKLQFEIEMEESYYETACDYPTDTLQFYKALDKQRIRIMEMRQKLALLTSEKKYPLN